MECIVVCSKWAANQKLLYKIINDHLGRTLSICIDHPFFCSCVLQRNMIHLKIGFLVAMCLFSSRSRMRSKCASESKESDTQAACQHVTGVLTNFFVFFDLLWTDAMITWNLLVSYNEKKIENEKTCPAPLDCLRICACS